MEDSMWGATEEESSPVDDLLLPLPLRPTGRARLPSPMRAKKALAACLDNLALPNRGSAALLKENIALESPIANLMSDPKCVPRPDLATENGHTPLAEREVVANNGNFACLQFVTSPSVMSTPARGSREAEGRAQSPARNFDERINGSAEQPSFSFLTVQESPATPVPENFALPATTATPSSGKKWKDDGTLRLKKVRTPSGINPSLS